MAAPAPTAFYVVHDVEGIKGLHLAVNAIGEGMEQRLFGHSSDPAAEQQFSSEMFQVQTGAGAVAAARCCLALQCCP